MSLLAAKSTENLNFKFFQLRKLAITNSFDTNVINNLAISHGHQIIFAAYGNAFKVIRISDLLDYEWDKKVLDTIVNSYPALEVKLPYKPSLLSVSGGANNLLLVFGQNSANNLSGDIFDILNLLTGNPNPVSKLEFPPAISQNCFIQSIAWHPEFSETLFAAITSNGALLTIGIDQQTRGVQLLAHYTDSYKFTCASWSPKGKQIVVGGDGLLTQFKHSNGKGFQKAKVIQPPADLSNHKIINVNWVHSALFQVAYVHKSATNSPDTRVIFIHAPTKTTPEFHDYGYVCMETAQYSGPDKMRVNFSEIGNVLLCLSSLSNEVNVIGCETPEINPSPTAWQQWMLDDSSRIELSAADGSDAYPVGIAWFKGPTKVFKINESVSFGGPGWPLVLVLSSAGVLCPYYACHIQGKFVIPDFPQPQPLPISVPAPARRQDNQTPVQQQQQQQIQQQQQQQLQQQNAAAQALLAKSPAQTFPTQQSQPVDASFTFSLPKTSTDKPKLQTTVTVAATIQAPAQQQQISQQYQQSQQQAGQQAQQSQQQQQNRAAPQSQPQQQVPSKPAISEEELRKKELEVMEETFSIAINEEILEFSKTLQNAKNIFSKALNLQIGKPDELATLQSETARLFELLKASSDTIKSLDLGLANGYLLETWAMVQEATTRLEKEADPVYTMLANRRSIDPITARKMREIKKMTHEIEIHLDDLNNMLDREWEEYTAQINAKKLPSGLSSIDMIYHTLSTHHKTIEMLKKSLSKYDVYLESIEIEEVSAVSPRRKEIQEIINSLKNTSIREDNSIISEISHPKSVIKIPTVTKEKKERLLEFFEQRNSVPVRRAILPVDLKSSKMVSAVVKAKERLKEIRAKSGSPVKSWDSPPSGLSRVSDHNSTLQPPRQVTPVKSAEKSDPDKSLFYSTAIGDMSLGDTSRYQSPVKSLNFLSPISTKTDQRSQPRPQNASDKSMFKEPEPADKSTPFVSKSVSTKDESFSLSFSTTMGNIASPTPSSSTFLFGPSSTKPTDKGIASTFASATKDISIISKDKDTPTSTTTKENVQIKSESKDASKSVTSTTANSAVTSTVPSTKPTSPFPAFTFASTTQPATSTTSSAPLFSFKPTTTNPVTTATSQSFTTSSVVAPNNTSVSANASTVAASKSNASAAPFSFSAASGFSFSTTANASSLFASPAASIAQSNNESKVSTSLFSTDKPSSTTGFSFGDATSSAAPSFSFGGSLTPNTTATSSTVTSTTVTPVTVTTSGTTSTTTSSTTSISSTTTTITPVPAQTFGFGTSTGQVSSVSSSVPSTTQPVFSLGGVKTEATSSTTTITPAGASVASTATTVTPVFTAATTSSAPLNLTAGSSIFSSSTAPVSSATTSVTAVAPSTPVFGISSALTPNATQQTTSTTTTPASTSLFGGVSATTPFFTPTTPTSFSLSSSQTDANAKANEPAPAFNFNTALANLGGQANPATTPANPFGSSIASPSPQLNLFSPKTTTQQSPSTFGSPSSMSSSFASQGPTVSQTGFGSFAAQNQPRFGAQPTFGGAPAFGAQPTFGGSPTFGSGPFGKTASNASLGFGQPTPVPVPVAPQPVQPTAAASPFGGFATANTPSFGALASQQAPTFGQLAAATQQPAVQQPQAGLFSGFGQPAQQATSPSIFGNTFPTAPAFGSPQFSQRRQ